MSPDTDDGPAPRTLAEERTLGPMRKTIATRLQESYENGVHVTASRRVDADALLAAANARDDPVTISDVLLDCLSDTLDAHPAFNATFEDGTHRIFEEHNVGVAVDIDAGLVTPVIADVAARSIDDIATERRRLTENAHRGDYEMRDLRNGTFTVSNLGVLGIDSFTPIINPPEIAILGIGRLTDDPHPTDDGGVEFRKQLTFDLSFDHRIVDGADAARFLATLAEHVEHVE